MPQQSTLVPAKEAEGHHTVYEIITQPIVLLVGTLLLVVIVAAGLYLLKIIPGWGGIQDAVSQYPEVQTGRLSVPLPSDGVRAKIVLPNGMEIRLDGNSCVIGRGDLARVLSLDKLNLISRRHFEVKSENEQFYIEDMGSANGTRLNGEDIGGQGQVSLSDNDLIEPAGAIRLTFLIL